jgi:hypothetical protein
MYEYVFPASHLKVYVTIEPGLAGEQSTVSGILMPTEVENAYVMSNSGGASSVRKIREIGFLLYVDKIVFASGECSSARPCN